ncbi:SPARC [Dermatophagoides farinae]|uniref:50s ribosome-binding gtpase-like protein n=1 Tax=Dermatophagoides farinae TaxID=6954 RepID=A0A9D4P309_DERFA|nr:SPARC-like [Dermatophagoides farinae]KAH7643469.1 50s ribosome-binding gtpase-like protein [Dermatophagoides farinae]
MYCNNEWIKCGALLLLVVVASIECGGAITGQESDKPNAVTTEDPCLSIKCGFGQECFVDYENNEANCICIRECPQNDDLRRRVCSNYNETWQSDCHLMKHRCDCLEQVNAVDSKYCTYEHKHMHIDYYGECKDIEPCRDEVLEDFPRRMRDWLDSIISLSRVEVTNSKQDMEHKWIDAIIWKFCDLDKEPHDRYVSRHELFPLRAPLLSMESCISDFLDGCDANDDHKITLVEWGKCLGASPDEMQDKCNQFISKA